MKQLLAPSCPLIGPNRLTGFQGPEYMLECHTHGRVTFKGENVKMTQHKWERQHEYHPPKPVSSWVAPNLWWMWESVGCYVVGGWGVWNVRERQTQKLWNPQKKNHSHILSTFSFLWEEIVQIFKKERKRNSSLEIIFIQSPEAEQPEVRQNFKLLLNHLVFIPNREWNT